jgi:predicted nuclease of predicted toxin-antitoxin system
VPRGRKVRLLIDECCRRSLVEALRKLGCDVAAVADLLPSVSDEDVLALAVRLDCILVTDDKDFGALVIRQGLPVPGIVLLRTSSDDGEFQARRLAELLTDSQRKIHGHMTVVEDTRFRTRPLRMER